jgi:hypothetical protein
MKNNIEIISHSNSLMTKGLALHGQQELTIHTSDEKLIKGYSSLLIHLSNYILEQGQKIVSGETISHGCWLLKVVENPQGSLRIYEMAGDGEQYVPGAARAVSMWAEQQTICESMLTEFDPPTSDLLAAVSEGVFQGLQTDGERCPAKHPMSGWWFFTELYKDDIKTMKTFHIAHVCQMRPDLVPYLALPFGFKFSQKKGMYWFDTELAAQETL